MAVMTDWSDRFPSCLFQW